MWAWRKSIYIYTLKVVWSDSKIKSTHDTVRPFTDKCGTAYAISYSNLIKSDTGPFIPEFSKQFKVMFLNAQSVRNKALDICDYYIISECWPSFPVWNMTMTRRRWGWLCSLDTAWFLFEASSPTVWYRWWAFCFASNQSYKKLCSFYLRFCIYDFWDTWSASFLWWSYCSVP